MAIIKNKNTDVSDSGSNKNNNTQKNKTNYAVYGSNYGGAAAQNNNANRNLYGSNYGGAAAQNNTNRNLYGSNYNGTKTPVTKSTQKNTQQTQRKTVFDYLKSYGTNSQGAAKTSVGNNLYGSNYNGARADQIDTSNPTGENRYKDSIQAIDKSLGSPMQNLFKTTNKMLNTASDYLEQSNQMTDLQKHHLDVTFSGYVDTDPVYSKIKNDRTYASKLIDEQGNLIDYSDQITKLQGQIDSTANPYERKELKQQIDLFKEYQSDQKKLQYASYYDYLQKNGASEEDLIAFKRDVVRDNYTGIERTLANFTSTVQSHVGNMVKGYETLYAKASDLFGEEYQMSEYVDKIIDEAEVLRQYSLQGAGGMEKLVYEVYDGMAPFLYSMMTAQFLGGDSNYLGNEEAAKQLTNKALLMSDVSTLGSKMKQNLDNGYDFDTSFNNAFFAAALSHTTEAIGGESLANILTGKIGEELLENTLSYTIRALANQFASEAIEEGMEAVFEPIIDKYTLNTGLTVQGYMDQVLSQDTLHSMLIGGLGGLAMGSIGTINAVSEFNTIADSIPMNSKADYNSAIEARNKLQEIVQKAEQSGSNTETDEAQIHNSKLLISAFNKKINRYAAANPYMDAFVSASDNSNIHPDPNPRSTILEAVAPDFTSKLDEIIQGKSEIGEQSQMAVETMQENLKNEGINASATDMASLSEEAATTARKVNDWAKATNKKVGFANLVSKSGEVIDGLYDSNSGQTLINPNGKNSIVSTLIHEFTHGTESSEYYSLLHSFVKEYLGNDYQTAIENIKDEYSTVQTLDDEGAAHELVAITAQELLGNEEFVDRLVRYDTSLAYRMYEEIRYANEQTGGALEGIEQNFMRAFKNAGIDENSQNVSMSKWLSAYPEKRLGKIKEQNRSDVEYNPQNYTLEALKQKHPEIQYTSFENNDAPEVIMNSAPADFAWSVIKSEINKGVASEDGASFLISNSETGNTKFDVKSIRHKKGGNVGISKRRMFLNIAPIYQNAVCLNELFRNGVNSKEMYSLYFDNGSPYLAKFIVNRDQKGSHDSILGSATTQPVDSEIIKKVPGIGLKMGTAYSTNISIEDLINIVKSIPDYKNHLPLSVLVDENGNSEYKKRISTDKDGNERYDIVLDPVGLKYSNGTNLDSLRRKDLMAIHNLSEDKLMKSLDLGGFSMPSIAVTKDSISHDNFGDISLVFDKNTIDPSNPDNRVYKRDAWTPMFPSIENEIVEDEAWKVHNDFYDLSKKVDNAFSQRLRNVTNDYTNTVATSKDLSDLIDNLNNDYALKAAYLEEQGIHVPVENNEVRDYSDSQIAMYEKIIDLLPDISSSSVNDLINNYGDDLAEISYDFDVQNGMDQEKANKRANAAIRKRVLINNAYDYQRKKNSNQLTHTETDMQGAYQMIDQNIDQKEYESWLRDKFSGMFGEKGIWNGKEYIKSDGDRRSFKELYNKATLKNIFEDMLSQKETGGDYFGNPNTNFSAVTGMFGGEFNSIDDIISNEEKLSPKEENDAQYTALKDRFNNLINERSRDYYKYYDPNGSVDMLVAMDHSIGYALRDMLDKPLTTKNVIKAFADNNYMIDEAFANDLIEVINEMQDLTTNYFEAKPRRIVSPNEIQTAVIPNTASPALRQRLADLGINTVEYDPNIEGDRAAKVNSLENLKFSKGLRLDNLISSARKDLRNIGEKDRRVNLTETLNKAVSDIRETGDVSQDVYNELREKVVESTRAKVPNGGYDDAQAIRRMIGNNFGRLRKDRWDVQLQELNDTFHMYDEHEVGINSYQDAQNFIDDYLAGLGEKYIYEDPVEMGYLSRMEYEDMVDNKLDEVITNLKNSINDQNAAENVADMLTNDDIEENMYRQGQENLDALLNEENDLLDRIEQASVGNLTPEELDNLEQESLEKISIEEAKQQVSPVLKEAATIKKPLRSVKDIMYQVRQKIFDKGIAIRDMKNRQLSVSYDTMLNADNMANYAILNGVYDSKGKKVADSLTSASKMIPESQKNDFDYYMYHKHNIDAAKIGKPVFMNFDSAKSQQIVNQYEMQYPEWKNVAQKYYDLNDQMLKKQVEHGVISQEMADHWKELYPHYVPTKRFMGEVNEENVVETADPQVASSNKGTLYERTGGTAPIQPLDYAMAEHIKQIYKSTLFNDFARDYIKASHSATNVFNEQRYIEEMVEASEDKVTKADEYTPATLIWYNNGERNIVEIPQNIYDAVKPSETPFNLPSNVPFLAWATKLRTNMITGANPVFWATNAVKDFQDIAFNSKYAKDTYLNLPRAYVQLLKGGEIANLYKSMGGEYQTYSSEAGINQNEHGKFYNATIGNFVKFNELVEMAPRLAEFMSSLDHGDSVETAMYNAAEVTTNFKRGGDYAKWVNRNGVNFLNASIQGFDKQIRNIEDAYDSKGWKGIVSYMAKSTLISGVPLVLLNGLLHRGDKDYEELSDYIKDNYYILWKYDDGKFVRIPKGRIANAYQGIMSALYKDGVELASDNDALTKAQNIWNNTLDGFLNIWEQVGINNPFKNNIFSPLEETIKNEAWYGEPIVSTYMQKKDPADQYDESTDLLSVWLGQKTNVSPMKINYLIDQYSGGAGDFILPYLTPKAETGLRDGSAIGEVTSFFISPYADKFTTDSVFKNQRVSDFFTLDEELTKMAQKEHASDETILSSKYINSIQKQMNDLYAEKREIQKDTSLSDAQKYERARSVQEQINDLARTGLDTYDQIDMDSYYGSVGGISYSKKNGEWSKVDADKEAMLNELGASTKEKSDYFYTVNTISEIRKDIKDETPEGEKAEYKNATINAIETSGLNPKMQNYLYDTYYSGKLTDNVNAMDISDEDKFAIKVASSKGVAAKDANGKTISNSKALSTADAYADAGVLDDVFDYIRENGLSPSDFGLTKTVYNYSYDGMAKAYQSVFGQQFGTGEATDDEIRSINNSYTSSGKSSGSSRSSSKRSSKSSSGSTLTKKEEARRRKFRKALLAFLKANRYNTSDLSDVLKGTTRLSDVEAKVKKAINS